MYFDVVEVLVICIYLIWVIELFWNECFDDCFDVEEVVQVFDEDYYGFEKVKDCVLEFFVVCCLCKECVECGEISVEEVNKGLILVFIGFFGVGKIFIVQSIVKLLGCKYVCIVFGGVCDELDIWGYCCIYIGVMLGCIIQGICMVGIKNLVILFDEVDKFGSLY